MCTAVPQWVQTSLTRSIVASCKGQKAEAVDALLNLEKSQRLAEDVGGTRRACQALLEVTWRSEPAIVTLAATHASHQRQNDRQPTRYTQVLREANDWPGLNEHILLLAKRRSQLKQAVQAFVRQAMGYVDEAPDEAARVELIKTLQSVTEGKVMPIEYPGFDQTV
jgi:26S proteasome regulatory subunit N5